MSHEAHSAYFPHISNLPHHGHPRHRLEIFRSLHTRTHTHREQEHVRGSARRVCVAVRWRRVPSVVGAVSCALTRPAREIV